MGRDGEVKVEGEEELELQLVELMQREAGNLGPEQGEASGGCISGIFASALKGIAVQKEMLVEDVVTSVGCGSKYPRGTLSLP